MAAITWTIKGQTGKTVDATAHALSSLQAQGALVSFNSLAGDTMSWTVWLNTPAQAATLVPDLGQQITLYRDGGRYFTGVVTGRRVRFQGERYSVDVVVSGPWWHLTQIFLSSETADQAGEASERSVYVFATGSPKDHIEAIIARAIAMGAPIRAGSIATCFDVPRLSLRNISFAEAHAELMRWIADGHVYFDYTGSDTVHPALCMQRRADATTVTLTPAAGIVPTIDVSPRLDLQVEEITVMHAARATVDNKRVTTWVSTSAGTATSGLPRRQPVLVSGPELDTYLPADFTDSVLVRSAALEGNWGEAFMQYDERLKSSGASDMVVGPYSVTNYQDVTYELPAITNRLVDGEGNAIPGGYQYYLTKGEVRSWWEKDGINSIMARLSATLFGGAQIYDLADPEPAAPAWAEVLGAQKYYWQTLIGGVLHNHVIYAITSSVVVPLVTQHWTADTTLIRAEDYAFVNPPTGLAANLLATQNWLPYEGSVTHVAEVIPAGHHVGHALNIAGLTSELADMRALIAGHSVRLATGESTYTLGAPGRFKYRDLVNRYRQSGADNIVWI